MYGFVYVVGVVDCIMGCVYLRVLSWVNKSGLESFVDCERAGGGLHGVDLGVVGAIHVSDLEEATEEVGFVIFDVTGITNGTVKSSNVVGVSHSSVGNGLASHELIEGNVNDSVSLATVVTGGSGVVAEATKGTKGLGPGLKDDESFEGLRVGIADLARAHLMVREKTGALKECLNRDEGVHGDLRAWARPVAEPEVDGTSTSIGGGGAKLNVEFTLYIHDLDGGRSTVEVIATTGDLSRTDAGHARSTRGAHHGPDIGVVSGTGQVGADSSDVGTRASSRIHPYFGTVGLAWVSDVGECDIIDGS